MKNQPKQTTPQFLIRPMKWTCVIALVFVVVASVHAQRRLTTRTQNPQIACGLASTFKVINGQLWASGLNFQLSLAPSSNIQTDFIQIGTDNNWISVACGMSNFGYGSNPASGIGLKADGTLWGWGANDNGQLGVGNNTSLALGGMRQIGTDNKWVSVSCGGRFTLALKSDGSLWSWGYNGNGQLGNGSTNDSNTPVRVGNTETKWVKIMAGYNYSLAIKSDGTLWSWGCNYGGELGDGTLDESHSPVQVGTDKDWLSLATGGYESTLLSYNVAIKSNGTLWGWGSNWSGQLGNGTTSTDPITSPVQIGTSTNWVKITADLFSLATYGLKSDGTLWKWGIIESTFGNDTSGTQTETYLYPTQLGSDDDWVDVDAEGLHVIAAKSTGETYTWGRNTYGELGLGSTTDNGKPTLAPTNVTLNSWKSIVAGRFHSSSIKSDGNLWSWGDNTYGQVGSGSTAATQDTPLKIGSDNTWVKISAGNDHTVALKANGTLWAWGDNTYGQLGNSTTINQYTPVQIGSDNTWIAISAGGLHTLGLKSNGTLWAWGANNNGQLGINSTTQQTAPTQIGSDNNWISISAGSSSTVALKSDGTLWTWGYNGFGQLGDGTTVQKLIPTKIGTDENWVSISAGYLYTLATKSNGTLWAWGSNSVGKLGDGTLTNRLSPVQIGTDTKWLIVEASKIETSVAVKSDGTLWAWGSNGNGQFGKGTTTNSSSPVQIGTDKTWVTTTSGSYHVLGIKAYRTEYCATGNNDSGQLGICSGLSTTTYICTEGLTSALITSTTPGLRKNTGTVTLGATTNAGTLNWYSSSTGGSVVGTGSTFITPTITKTTVYYVESSSNPCLLGRTPVIAFIINNTIVSTSVFSSHIIKSDGTLWGWGYNHYGELGDGTTTDRLSPVQIGSDNQWISISDGEVSSIGLKSDGSIWTWGDNSRGQIGDGTNVQRNSPIRIGTSTWVCVAASFYRTYAIKSDGTLWGWGGSGGGATGVGDGTTTQRNSPIQIGTDNTWISIAAAETHTLGIKANGTLWAWGENSEGQLGDGTTTIRQSPVQIGSATNWSNVICGAGFRHSAAIKSDGTLWTWGWNSRGELGIGNTTQQNSPVQVGTATDWAVVATGWELTHALKKDGSLWSIGSNYYGQLGFGSITTVSTPTTLGSEIYRGISSEYRFSIAVKADNTFCGTGNNNYGQLNTGNITATTTYSCGAITGLRLESEENTAFIENYQELQVFPNPNAGSFTIKANKEGLYNIINQWGQTIQTVELTLTNNRTVEVTNLNDGIYSVIGLDRVLQQRVVVIK